MATTSGPSDLVDTDFAMTRITLVDIWRIKNASKDSISH